MADLIRRRSFIGGEIDSRFTWRNDLERYHSSCLKLRNFIVQPHGGVTRRPGFVHALDLKAVAAEALATHGVTVTAWRQCVPFAAYADTPYAILIAEANIGDTSDPDKDGLAFIPVKYETSGGTPFAPLSPHPRFVDGHGIVTNIPSYIPADYEANAYIPRWQYQQINDVLYLAHPKVHPLKISRTDADTFRVDVVTAENGPFLDQNTDASKIVWTETPVWDSATEYDMLDAVRRYATSHTIPNGQSTSVGRPALKRIDGIMRQGYQIKIPMSGADAANYLSGQRVAIWGTTHYNGDFIVGAVDTGTSPGLWFDFGVWKEHPGDPAYQNYQAETFGAAARIAAVPSTWFSSAADGNQNNDPDDDDGHWYQADSRGWMLTLRVNYDLFEDGMEGGLFQLIYPREKTTIKGQFGGAGFLNCNSGDASESMFTKGNVTLQSDGQWSGRLELQVSLDDGATWFPVGSIVSVGGNNNGIVSYAMPKEGGSVRVHVADYSATYGAYAIHYTLTTDDVFLELPVRIVSVVGPREALVYSPYRIAYSKQTHRWAEGAWSPLNGYPRTVCIHEERLVFGGNERRPQTVWGSAINDWEDWEIGSFETSPIAYSIASDASARIQWLASKESLIVGTESNEWTIGSRNREKVLSAENVSVQRHSEYGSRRSMPVMSTDMLFFIERGGRRIRALKYSYEQDSFVAPDMSILASHMFEVEDSATAQTAQLADSASYIRVPWQGVFFRYVHPSAPWAIQPNTSNPIGDTATSNAALRHIYMFRFDEEEQINAWQEIHFPRFGNSINDLFTLQVDEADILFVHIDDGLYAMDNPHTLRDEDYIYLDGYYSIGTVAAATAYSLPHEANDWDGMLVFDEDGPVGASAYTLGGTSQAKTITFDDARAGVYVGWSYASEIHLTPFAGPDEPSDGAASKRTNLVALFPWKSHGGEVSVDGGESWHAAPDAGITSDRVDIRVPSSFDSHARVAFRTSAARGYELLSIGTETGKYR